MAWLRSGDNAGTYPLLLQLSSTRAADERLMNEAAGFLWRCAMQSAGHMTDGLIDHGTAVLMGNGRHDELLAACVQVGLLKKVRGGRSPQWQMHQDPEFIHIRARAEIEWERQRKRDNSNPDLVGPVKLRDGDACRFCGNVVNWNVRKGNRGGTYHHREPGKDAKISTLVVCCFKCNTEMGDAPLEHQKPILPPPEKPYYGQKTLEYFEKHNIPIPERPDTQPDTAQPATTPTVEPRTPDEAERLDTTDTAAGTAATPPAGPRPTTERPGPRTPQERPGPRPTDERPDWQDNAAAPPPFATPGDGHRTTERPAAGDTATPDLQIPADPGRSEVYGPGRDGTGRAGPGRVGAGAPPAKGPRKRARRGKP